jgi:hypothetical protein
MRIWGTEKSHECFSSGGFAFESLAESILSQLDAVKIMIVCPLCNYLTQGRRNYESSNSGFTRMLGFGADYTLYFVASA